MVAQAAMLGGNLRVGLEDNLYLSRGVFASNAQLVERARALVEGMGAPRRPRRGPAAARARGRDGRVRHPAADGCPLAVPLMRVAPDRVARVGIVGAGVMGGGWAAHFLRMGLDVSLYEPVPAARDGALALLEVAWPALERLGLREGASRSRLRFTDSLEETVTDADVVQRRLPSDWSRSRSCSGCSTRPRTRASSCYRAASGLRMTDIQARCANPGRTVVGHPFNPPYLIPLVEVVAGERTDPAVAGDWAVGVLTRHTERCRSSSMSKRQASSLFAATGRPLPRNAAHGRCRRGDRRTDRYGHGRRAGPALGGAGAWPRIPPCRRKGRHGTLPRLVGADAEGAALATRGARADP